jgi:hypothetical protein
MVRDAEHATTTPVIVKQAARVLVDASANRIAGMQMFYEPAGAPGLIIRCMNGSKERSSTLTRVLSLTLPEGEWRSLLELEPEPIAWLREQIRERLDDRHADAVSHAASGRPSDACGHLS